MATTMSAKSWRSSIDYANLRNISRVHNCGEASSVTGFLSAAIGMYGIVEVERKKNPKPDRLGIKELIVVMDRGGGKHRQRGTLKQRESCYAPLPGGARLG